MLPPGLEFSIDFLLHACLLRCLRFLLALSQRGLQLVPGHHDIWKSHKHVENVQAIMTRHAFLCLALHPCSGDSFISNHFILGVCHSHGPTGVEVILPSHLVDLSVSEFRNGEVQSQHRRRQRESQSGVSEIRSRVPDWGVSLPSKVVSPGWKRCGVHLLFAGGAVGSVSAMFMAKLGLCPSAPSDSN